MDDKIPAIAEDFIAKARATEQVEAIEVYWEYEPDGWFATVFAVARRPSWGHPHYTVYKLGDFWEERQPAFELACAVGKATAAALGVPFHCAATADFSDAPPRWMAREPLSERDWELTWQARALHCAHTNALPPVELAGEVTVRAVVPGGAIRAACDHALAQLPQGDDWRRDAHVRLTVDGVELTHGGLSPVPTGDADF